MDELELLKKDWKNQEGSFKELSYTEIYSLIHKKSSSIVKWIFIICIIEFAFWGLMNFFVPESAYEVYEKFNLRTFLYGTQVVHYIVVFVFIYLFYKNYKSISVIDNTNLLMKKIINTRRTVNYYVFYNIIMYAILSIILNVIMFSQPDLLVEVFNQDNIDIPKEKFYNIILIAQIIVFFVIIGLFLLYYRIIYGILLRKLSRNYAELDSLES